MTVYNVTKLSPSTARAIAKYYKVDKVELRYSDWVNQFGAVVKRGNVYSVDGQKRVIAHKYLMNTLGNMDINLLRQCPIIYPHTGEFNNGI